MRRHWRGSATRRQEIRPTSDFTEIAVIKSIDGVEIDRHRQELAVDAGEHAVLVLAPGGEARKIIENLLRVRMENMRSVFVHEDAGGIVMIVGIAADVTAAIAN